MRNWTLDQWIVLLVFLLFLAWLNGCPFVGRTGIDPQKLAGTWRATADDADYTWTFSRDGTTRIQIEPHQAWVRFFGGSLDLRGRWRLKGDQLTIELTETPPLQALFGENLKGQTATLRIQHVTDEELDFVGDDPPFRRSLVPPPSLSVPDVGSSCSHSTFTHSLFKDSLMRILYINNDGGGFADQVEVADGTTVSQFFQARVGGKAPDYLIRVNRQPCTADQVLHDGDRLTVTPVKIEGARPPHLCQRPQ